MKKADFFATMHTIAPGSTPEAVQKWIDFAVERVNQEQYANFAPSKDPEANIEKWLDTLCGGVYMVRAEYGAELTGNLVNLSLDKCCLYPGEMLQAAECLREGGTAETILNKITSDEIESERPFFPVPLYQLTDWDCGPELRIMESKVPVNLLEKRFEPGYILWNMTVLLESERDKSGCYKSGAGMDGIYLRTPELYRPVYTDDGQLRAFRQVKPMPELYLTTVEMSVKDSRINGITNNTRKPSVLDNLRQYQQEARKSQIKPTPRRDQER